MDNQNKDLYEVNIKGISLTLKSAHDMELIEAISNIVNNKMDELSASNKELSFQNVLILTALNLAEDLVLLKKSTLNKLDSLEEKSNILLSNIENISTPPADASV